MRSPSASLLPEQAAGDLSTRGKVRGSPGFRRTSGFHTRRGGKEGERSRAEYSRKADLTVAASCRGAGRWRSSGPAFLGDAFGLNVLPARRVRLEGHRPSRSKSGPRSSPALKWTRARVQILFEDRRDNDNATYLVQRRRPRTASSRQQLKCLSFGPAKGGATADPFKKCAQLRTFVSALTDAAASMSPRFPHGFPRLPDAGSPLAAAVLRPLGSRRPQPRSRSRQPRRRSLPTRSPAQCSRSPPSSAGQGSGRAPAASTSASCPWMKSSRGQARRPSFLPCANAACRASGVIPQATTPMHHLICPCRSQGSGTSSTRTLLSGGQFALRRARCAARSVLRVCRVQMLLFKMDSEVASSCVLLAEQDLFVRNERWSEAANAAMKGAEGFPVAAAAAAVVRCFAAADANSVLRSSHDRAVHARLQGSDPPLSWTGGLPRGAARRSTSARVIFVVPLLQPTHLCHATQGSHVYV